MSRLPSPASGARCRTPDATRRTLRVAAVLSALTLAACSGDSPPTGPEDGPEVASIEIEPGSLALQLGETESVTATVLDADDDPVAGAAVTWSSTDESVATVDQAGLVTGAGAGVARIEAMVDGVSSEIDVEVTGWNIDANAVVVDSLALRLVSDSDELDAGTYRFEVLGDAPEISEGDVLVGAQDGGFLRQVTDFDLDGDELTAQTTEAALVDVVRYGGFETSVALTTDGPSLIPGVAPSAGEVHWGPVELLDAAPGVSLAPAGLSVAGLDFCSALGGCPSTIESFELASGTIEFDPTLDLEATIEEYALTDFEAVATGDLTLDFSVLLEAKQATQFEASHTLATIQRVFYAQIGAVPVVGIIQFEIVAGFKAGATIKGKIQGGFQNQHTLSVGARYAEASGWEGVLDGSQTFGAHEPSLGEDTLEGQIDLEARVSVTPQLDIILYGLAGPFINVEPYGQATLAFGTDSCGLRSIGGIESTIGFAVAMLDPSVGTFDHTFSPVAWPGLEWDCPLGQVDVGTITNGDDPDEDGYTILVDGEEKGVVPATGSALVEWVPVGTRSIELADVAANCTVEGDNPREVDVEIALASFVDFVVDCEEAFAYEATFDAGAAGPEWSTGSIELAPGGERFLGLFTGAGASLNLTDLPTHDEVTIELDLHIVGSWNGQLEDVITMTVASGPTLLNASFSNEAGDWQSYPGNLGGSTNPPGTGADAVNSLGYPPRDDGPSDVTYRLSFTVDHTAPTFGFTVTSSVNTDGSDRFGIDNVRVTVD